MAATETPICDFGWKAVDFDLPGVDGRRYRLADVQGPNGLLVMFLCNHCPFVKAVVGRLVATVDILQREHGIGAIAIMSNDTARYPEDGFEAMQRFAATHGFTFPYVIDETQQVARRYRAVCTPDFFGFNRDLALQYRGRLDASRLQPVPDAEPELLNAMVGVARTGRGPDHQIPSIGCSIKWADAA